MSAAVTCSLAWCALGVLCVAALAVTTPPVTMTAAQDRQRLMDLLHITALRPGADGRTPSSPPNPANYDEAKAALTSSLPDPLRLNDGTRVTTAKLWWTRRRPEIVEDFDREVYGRVPQHTPKVHWEVTGTTRTVAGTVPAIMKQLVGHVDNSQYPPVSVNIQLTLTIPANAPGPVPVILQLSWPTTPTTDLTWQQQVLERGWGYACLVPTSIQADNGAGLTQGIIGLCNQGRPRGVDDWGALRAWAWGASRALDYFETDRAVDAKQIGVEGHSRYGKAALLAMAYDSRFAVAYVNSSGEGGAKLWRRNWGEQEGNIAGSTEYHWMAGNFLKYDGPLTPNDLPVDAHELIALCAPRPVFISGGVTEGDGWADTKGTFLAAVAAGPVYRLLGRKDLGAAEFPPTGTALIDGDIGFRQHDGGHTDAPNWPTFLTFAGHYFDNGRLLVH